MSRRLVGIYADPAGVAGRSDYIDWREEEEGQDENKEGGRMQNVNNTTSVMTGRYRNCVNIRTMYRDQHVCK